MGLHLGFILTFSEQETIRHVFDHRLSARAIFKTNGVTDLLAQSARKFVCSKDDGDNISRKNASILNHSIIQTQRQLCHIRTYNQILLKRAWRRSLQRHV